LIRSFLKLQEIQVGFNSKDLVIAQIGLPRTRYQTGPQEASLYHALIARLNSTPGVQGAAAGSTIFLSRLPSSAGFTIEGQTETIAMPLTIDSISPSFFQVMGIELRRGRFFSDLDRNGSTPVVIINETTARRYWSNADPLGKRFKFGAANDDAPWLTIVGVVADTRRAGVENAVFTESYEPLAQQPRNNMTVVVRGRPREALPSIIRSELRSLDAQIPISSLVSIEEPLDRMTAPRRFNTVLLGLFAGTALLLAVVGLYGILAHFVAIRQREIGIRLAVGADRRHVIGVVAGHALSVLASGLALGLAVGFASVRLLATMLFGIQTWDPLTLSIVITVTTIGAIGASFLPALRASHVDPITALRCE
jgi:putative ABC transport system permease protein